MTLTSTVRERSYNPTAGSSFSSVTDTVRIYDDAGASVTIPGVAAEIPAAGSAHADTTNYPGFYVVATSLSQPESKVIDMTVEYTNEVQWLDRDSATPQDVNREAAGYASISTSSGVQFVDIWYRHSTTDPFNEAAYPDGAVSGIGGSTTTYQGNVDSAGEPISWPVVIDQVSISLTRDSATDPVPWSTINSTLGKRNSDSFLGWDVGKLLFTGCRVNETFPTGLVNYDLTFVAEQFWHLRQRVEKDDLGPKTYWDSNNNSHAAEVRLYQPFPVAAFAGLLTTGTDSETALLTPKVS